MKDIIVSGATWQVSRKSSGSYLLETWNQDGLWRIDLTPEQVSVYQKGIPTEPKEKPKTLIDRLFQPLIDAEEKERNG